MSREVYTTYGEYGQCLSHVDGKVYGEEKVMTEEEWLLKQKIKELEEERKSQEW